MNRSDFFKKLGLGVITVAVAPKILAEVKKKSFNDAICLECGYRDDMNSFNVNVMDECDPNPTIECPKCGGIGEFID